MYRNIPSILRRFNNFFHRSINEMCDFMKIAKEEAILGMNKGEIPVGAVIVKNGVIIGKAHNLKETLNDSTAHAEIIAIKEASKNIGSWRLSGTEMYVTLEPCPMCASAIFQSRNNRILSIANS